MIFFRFPFQCDLKLLEFHTSLISVDLIKEKVQSHLGYEEFVLFCNGKQIYNKDVIPDESTVQVAFSLPGGKGGFGSMLRAIGAQIEKTTNREACRDLSGRRLRDINEEQRLKKWISKEAEREAEKIKRRQARIERLKTKAPHNFFDFEYEKEISELPNRVNEALNEGLQKAKQPTKRPIEEPKIPKKSWLGEDFPLSSSESDSDEASDGSAPKKLKKDLKDSSTCESDMSESSQSQSIPSSSKYSSYTVEDSSSSSCNSENTFTKVRSVENDDSSETALLQVQGKETTNEMNSNKNDENLIVSSTSESKSHPEESEIHISKDVISVEEKSLEVEMEISQSGEKPSQKSMNGSDVEGKNSGDSETVSTSKSLQPAKQPETKKDDDIPIDPMEFQSASELEGLGLDRLKSALIAHGLKCGGTLSDRAQRLWKIRGLQPHEYPANLLAKNKK